MKNIIKEYVEIFDNVIEKAKEIKEKHNNDDIRIGTSYVTGGHQRTEYYYYNPKNGKVKDGAVFMGNGSQYSYKNIGDIEILVIRNNDNDYIRISRVIQPYYENMNYSDDYEEAKFNKSLSKDKLKKRREQRFKKELYRKNAGYIVECINCGKEYLSLPQLFYNTKIVENGKVAFLNENETKLICHECVKNMTIEEFIENENQVDQERAEKFERYLLEYIGLDKSDMLFEK